MYLSLLFSSLLSKIHTVEWDIDIEALNRTTSRSLEEQRMHLEIIQPKKQRNQQINRENIILLSLLLHE